MAKSTDKHQEDERFILQFLLPSKYYEVYSYYLKVGCEDMSTYINANNNFAVIGYASTDQWSSVIKFAYLGYRREYVVESRSMVKSEM